MKAKLLSTIEKYNMFSKGDTVAVGLSGGADSMCLLSMLNDLKDELGIRLIAAHVNHCIRGSESDRDEEFVCKFCSEKNIEITVKRIDIPNEAKISGESTELCARRLRYAFFNELDADVIATAHTGSDRIETFLMNLSRGASLDGLCSIPPVRENIIRPLICFTRSDIECYCNDNNISYVTDSTNFSNDYTRNRFRHNVVPELCNINPTFEENALRCLDLINSDNDYLDSIAKVELNKYFTDDNKLLCNDIVKFDDALKRRILVLYLEKSNVYDYSFKHIRYIADNLASKFSVMLPGGIRISGDGNYIFFDELLSDYKTARVNTFEFNKNEAIVFSASNSIILTEIADYNSFVGNDYYLVDFDKIDDSIRIRSRLSGDIIHLGKRKCSKSLKKFFNEMKIPVDKRDSIAILSDKNGIIFVEGIGVDSTRCPDKNTRKVLIIKMKGC